MLTISRSQLEIFRRDALNRHARELAARLAVSGHRSWRTREDLPAIVHRSVLWAWKYGLRSDRELNAFAELALYVGEHFHAYPPFHAILVSDEEDKLAALNGGSSPGQWLEAETFSRAIECAGKEASVGA